jgi:hypothetical protein
MLQDGGIGKIPLAKQEFSLVEEVVESKRQSLVGLVPLSTLRQVKSPRPDKTQGLRHPWTRHAAKSGGASGKPDNDREAYSA